MLLGPLSTARRSGGAHLSVWQWACRSVWAHPQAREQHCFSGCVGCGATPIHRGACASRFYRFAGREGARRQLEGVRDARLSLQSRGAFFFAFFDFVRTKHSGLRRVPICFLCCSECDCSWCRESSGLPIASCLASAPDTSFCSLCPTLPPSPPAPVPNGRSRTASFISW